MGRYPPLFAMEICHSVLRWNSHMKSNMFSRFPVTAAILFVYRFDERKQAQVRRLLARRGLRSAGL